jgi:hypothetical protein
LSWSPKSCPVARSSSIISRLKRSVACVVKPQSICKKIRICAPRLASSSSLALKNHLQVRSGSLCFQRPSHRLSDTWPGHEGECVVNRMKRRGTVSCVRRSFSRPTTEIITDRSVFSKAKTISVTPMLMPLPIFDLTVPVSENIADICTFIQ